MKLFKGIYRVESARLKDWDYSTPWWYYVTICTKGMKCFFGKIKDGNMIYNQRPQKNHPVISKEVVSPKKTINKTEMDQIYEILIHSKQFSVKTGMMNLVKLLGFDVVFSKKDSRARAARRLAMAIASSPEQIKKKALSMLYEMSDNQTRGWIDIIRSK